MPRYGITLITEPAAEPVTVAEVKTHARIDHDASDIELAQVFIPAARAEVENRINRSLINTTWKLTLPCFPPSNGDIQLPKGKVQSVSTNGFQYVDTNNVTQTLSNTNYVLYNSHEPAYVCPAMNVSWPSTRTDIPTAVSITYVAGYGAKREKVPEVLRLAVLNIAAFRYQHRGDGGRGLPFNAPVGGVWQVFELIDTYRIEDEFICYGTGV